jgi:hypothetical protein
MSDEEYIRTISLCKEAGERLRKYHKSLTDGLEERLEFFNKIKEGKYKMQKNNVFEIEVEELDNDLVRILNAKGPTREDINGVDYPYIFILEAETIYYGWPNPKKCIYVKPYPAPRFKFFVGDVYGNKEFQNLLNLLGDFTKRYKNFREKKAAFYKENSRKTYIF